MMWRTLSGTIPFLLAFTAGAQPAVKVLPQPPLAAAERTTIEAFGPAGTRQIEIDLREQVVEIPVEGPSPWHLRCADPGLWCQELMLAEDAAGPWPFPIFRRAELIGWVPRRAAGEPIERIVIQGWVEYSADETPMLIVLDLPVEEGTFRSEIPHASIDLRIAMPGSAPLYRWDLRPDDEGRVDLGELSPVNGGSVSGFLSAPSDATTAGATVELEPLAAAVPPQVIERLGRMEHVATADASGFFQLPGVVPGRYRLTAEKEELRAVVEALEIEADEELHLRHVPLQGSRSLRVRVRPRRPPGDGRWTLVLSGAEIETREEVASEEGEVILDGLHDGIFRLGVLTPDRDRILEQAVSVSEDRTVELRTDLIPVRGEVRLGGEPVVARVVVETGGGDATGLESDFRGVLEGAVPRPKRRFLRLRVLAPHAVLDRTLELVGEEVEIEDDVLHLRLELSEARVKGKVVDEGGQPVRGAVLEAADAWLPASETSSGLDGGFVLDGLEPGSYWISARHPTLGAGEPVRVELSDSSSTPEVLLVMRPARRIRGSLTAADGSPVASNDLRGMWSAGRGAQRSIAPGLEVEEIRALAPGRWAATHTDEPGWKFIGERCLAQPDPDLRWATVLPAAEALLEVDVVAEQRRRIEGR